MLDKSGKDRWLKIGFRSELLGGRVGQQILCGGRTYGGTDKKAVDQRETGKLSLSRILAIEQEVAVLRHMPAKDGEVANLYLGDEIQSGLRRR